MTQAVHVDHAIARRILGGDRDAFRQLFDQYFPRLYRYVLARLDGDHDGAQEVVQLTFCKAIERLDSYRGDAALYTWFQQVCRNTLLDYCRANQRRRHLVLPLEERPDVRAILDTIAAPVAGEPEHQAWRVDVQRLVQATVDALPDRYGEVLELKYVDGLAVKQIAQRMALTDKAAESLLARAREAFRAAITEMAGTPGALDPPGTSRGVHTA